MSSLADLAAASHTTARAVIRAGIRSASGDHGATCWAAGTAGESCAVGEGRGGLSCGRVSDGSSSLETA